MKMSVQHWWNDTDRGKNRSTRRKACSNAHFVHQNFTWIGLGSNPGLRGETPATDRLSYGVTALTKLTVLTVNTLHLHYKEQSGDDLVE
jgi:hypothetical protein